MTSFSPSPPGAEAQPCRGPGVLGAAPGDGGAGGEGVAPELLLPLGGDVHLGVRVVLREEEALGQGAVWRGSPAQPRTV